MSNRRPDLYHRYVSRVEFLDSLDLSTAEALALVAREQCGGLFEHFYSEPIPSDLWRVQVQHAVTDLAPPEHLGGAGALLARLLEGVGSTEAPTPFQLPPQWRESSVPLEPRRVELPINSNETPSQVLRRYFHELAASESLGLGGRELMVSMNEDVAGPAAGRTVSAYHPASFNFQLATEEGSLASGIMRGDTKIEVSLGRRVVDQVPGSERS